MSIRAIVFDIGGVLEYEIETGKNAKWEARLGLKPGEYRERLFSSGLAMDATYGKISEEAMWLRYKPCIQKEAQQRFCHCCVSF